jgi:elongation factor P
MLIAATQVRAGMMLQLDGALFRVMKTQHVTPGNWRGMMQTTLRNLQSGAKVEKRFRSTDKVERVTVESQDMEYLYADGDQYVFMHPETYDQTAINKDLVEEGLPYMVANTHVTVDFFEGRAIGLSLPTTVDLRVTETEPSMRGATATASMKPATLETGLVVQVPQFVQEGDVIRVDTSAGTYVSRA